MNRLIEYDKWPAGRPKIEEEIDRRMKDLLYVNTMEQLYQQRGFIEALQWVIATVDPPRRESNDEDC